MKIKYLILFLSALAFAAAEAASGMRDEIVEQFSVKPGGTLDFDADLGNIEITTDETDLVRVEFIREFKVNTAAEADALRQKLTVEMNQANNTVKVIVRFPDERKNHERRRVRLDFRIAMPKKFNLELRSCGSAKVANLDGSVKARMLGGSMQLGDVTGPVTARTDGGSLSLGDVGGDLDAHSLGGSVATGRVNGRVNARAEGGSVTIHEATDSIDARASGGSVAAYISKQPRGDSKIIAEAGNIELRLPPTVAVNVDAACSAGRLSTEFSLHGDQNDDPARLKGPINGGGPLVLLRASAGNIHLRK